MAGPTLIALREHAMERLDRGQTFREAAVLDLVPSSAVKWPQRRRRTGFCAPVRPGGRRARKTSSKHEVWLLERAGDAFTLRRPVGELARQCSPLTEAKKHDRFIQIPICTGIDKAKAMPTMELDRRTRRHWRQCVGTYLCGHES